MKREVIIILGKTGCGKSWWAKHAVKESERLAVFDPLGSPEYRVQWIAPDDIDGMEDAYRQREFRMGIVDPEGLESLGSFAYAYGPVTLVLEEFSTIQDKGQRPPEWLRRLIFLGRHKAVNLVAVAQRAVSIPIELRSQASRIVSFAQHEADDLGWLEEFYGPDITDTVPDLPKFTCVDYRTSGEIDRYSIQPIIKTAFGVELSRHQTEVRL